MKNEQPRLDDAVQRVVEAKYNELQVRVFAQQDSRSVCSTNDHGRKKSHKYHKQTFNRHLTKNYHLNYLLSTLSQT